MHWILCSPLKAKGVKAVALLKWLAVPGKKNTKIFYLRLNYLQNGLYWIFLASPLSTPSVELELLWEMINLREPPLCTPPPLAQIMSIMELTLARVELLDGTPTTLSSLITAVNQNNKYNIAQTNNKYIPYLFSNTTDYFFYYFKND